MKRVLLIDGDFIAYKTAAVIERPIHWGDGLWTLHAWANEGIESMDAEIARLSDNLRADKIVIALTDQGKNWRTDVYPLYKSNRKNTRKPVCLNPMREHLLAEYECFLRPGLEGDDVIGVLATHPTLIPGEKIIVSADKDFFTIPGKFVRTAGPDAGKLVTITEAEADRFHMIQSLAGDPTDGYPGCPGIGMDRAAPIIDGKLKAVPYEHTFTRGPRKGQVEIRFEDQEADTVWEAIVSRYAAAGFGEEYALAQAQVARILRASDYNFTTKEPILWKPK